MQYQRKKQVLKASKRSYIGSPASSKINISRPQGNYVISKWKTYSSDLALIPEYANELFDVNRDKTNVLIYMDEKDVQGNNNVNMFLALSLAKDSKFNVAITNNADAGISDNADVVINLFSVYDEGFDYGLKTYDDGSRYFVNANEFSKIKSLNELKKFIEDLKNGFADKLVGEIK